MPKTHNNKGRSLHGGKHLRLDKFIFQCEAYRSLSVYSRTLYSELKFLYNGSNNGKIHLSLKRAAELCNCSDKPIRKAFLELQEKGFIKISKKGGFNIKNRQATEYILTEEKLGNSIATKDYLNWNQEKSRCT